MDNPLTLLGRWLGGPPAGPDYSGQLAELRKAVTDLTTVTAAQNERIEGQRNEIEKSHQLIKALQTVEQQLRGDQREAYSRITALEMQLSEERTARTTQATAFGDMQAQLRIADQRLKHQRDELNDQAKKIAVLEDERAKYQGLYAGEAMAKVALEKDLAAAQAEIARLALQVEALEAEVASLKAGAG